MTVYPASRDRKGDSSQLAQHAAASSIGQPVGRPSTSTVSNGTGHVVVRAEVSR